MAGGVPFWEPLRRWAWLQMLRLGSWLWPIEVHHLWTESETTMLLRLPAGFREVSLKLLQITDAHISEGPLEAWERPHAERMHAAFRGARSPANGSEVLPLSVFRELVDLAVAAEVDVVALSGDVLSFPQASTAVWVARTLNSSLRHRTGRRAGAAVPYLYTAGNHDWFYEGSPASQPALQRRWRQSALHPLYGGSATWAAADADADADTEGAGRPLPARSLAWSVLTGVVSGSASDGRRSYDFGAFEVGGALLLTLDNSRFQVSHEQVEFLRAQLLRWLPTVLILHVPLSISESLRPFHGYALCGDPAWGEATDRSWRDERRARWPQEGNERATELLLETVLAAAAPRGPLIAVLSGHVHHHDATPFGEECFGTELGAWGAVQYIGLPALDGGHRLVELGTAPTSPRTPRRQGGGDGGIGAGVSGGAVGEGAADGEGAVGATGPAGAASAAATSAAELQVVLVARICSRSLLRGLAAAAADAVLREGYEAGGPLGRRALLWHCFGGASAADAAAAALDPGLVERGLGVMLRRTHEAVGHGFLTLAAALLPLLSPKNRPSDPQRCPAVFELLETALPEWASPMALQYEPGRLLELSPGCSLIGPVNEAVGAWRRGDWEALGVGLASLLRATSAPGCPRAAAATPPTAPRAPGAEPGGGGPPR